MIGFPSVGKSTLLTCVTDTASLSAAYEFTTLTCIPGAADGKGRGRQVIAVAKNSDMILLVVEAAKAEEQKVKISREL